MSTLAQRLDEMGRPRYGECAEAIWGTWECIAIEGEADYQGGVEFIVHDPEDMDHFVKYGWTYGSCSGCDTWEAEGADDAKIEAEMRAEAVDYNGAALNTLRIMLDRTEDPNSYRSYPQPPLKDQIEEYMRSHTI